MAGTQGHHGSMSPDGTSRSAGHVHDHPMAAHDLHGHGHGPLEDHAHHDDIGPDPARVAELNDAIWKTDNVVLTTVGIDIGSATSHLLFSSLHMRRQAAGYSSRFAVVSRQVLHKSPIMLTPYRPDGLIDAETLRQFIDKIYREAGFLRSDVDAGAVILTGVALERANARAIAELFAADGGRFVCAAAGHNLEALLAAHGSGAVARSRLGGSVLNVDVGGGTTKLALCIDGEIAGTLAIAAGSRLLAFDADAQVTRLEHGMADLGSTLGIALAVGSCVSPPDRRRLAEALAERIGRAVEGRADEATVLAGEQLTAKPSTIVFSGGVAEYVAAPAGTGHDDLGHDLAAALVKRLDRLGIPLDVSAERIRATVIGASQFSVQLSGNTVHVSGAIELPVHGVPVVAVDVADHPFPTAEAIRAEIDRRATQLDILEREQGIAVAIGWDGEPRYDRLRALADGIAAAHRASVRRDTPVMLALRADIGASIGSILEHELGVDTGVIAIDGLDLADLDFIDIGERILPANVVPVVVKSLVFPDPGVIERPVDAGVA